jgi:hypothetical protein
MLANLHLDEIRDVATVKCRSECYDDKCCEEKINLFYEYVSACKKSNTVSPNLEVFGSCNNIRLGGKDSNGAHQKNDKLSKKSKDIDHVADESFDSFLMRRCCQRSQDANHGNSAKSVTFAAMADSPGPIRSRRGSSLTDDSDYEVYTHQIFRALNTGKRVWL